MKRILSILFSLAIIMAMPTSVAADKWEKTSNGYVYKYDNGTTAEKGWLKIDGKTYYIKKDGTRQIGWLKTKTAKYYFDKNGVMQKNKWITMKSGDKYYLMSNGKAATGIVDIKSNKKTTTYKFDDDGKYLGKNYHFILNTESLCLHYNKCAAASKIRDELYEEIDIGENEFDEYSENGYWACRVGASDADRREQCNPLNLLDAFPKPKDTSKTKK